MVSDNIPWLVIIFRQSSFSSVEKTSDMAQTKDKRKDQRNKRVLDGTILGQPAYTWIAGLLGLVFLIYAYNYVNKIESRDYNNNYPLTQHIKKNSVYTFRIGK